MKYNILFGSFPVLKNDEIILKKIDKNDLNDLYEIYSNEKLYWYKPGNAKKALSTVRNMISLFERDFSKKKTICLGIYLNNDYQKLVGVTEIFDIDRKAGRLTIDYMLNEQYWGKGIATKSTAILIDYLFKVIGVNRIQAFVMPVNIKSQKVFRNNSFVKEGTIRQCHIWTGKGIVDLELYSILKEEYIK